jgi:hypothetical protein
MSQRRRASLEVVRDKGSLSAYYGNDGFPNLYVTQYGRSNVYQNNEVACLPM